MASGNLLTWFGWLKRWLRHIFRRNQIDDIPLLILERTYSTDGKTLLLSVERNTPGACATWYLIHRDCPRNKLLITLDNLAAVRLALQRNQFSSTHISKLKLSPDRHDPILRTHRFSVQWINQLNSSRTVYSLIGTWDADLQGNSFDPNARAIAIFRLVMREALNIRLLASMPWRTRMTSFPWSETVQSYAHALLGDKHDCFIKELSLSIAALTPVAHFDSTFSRKTSTTTTLQMKTVRKG